MREQSADVKDEREGDRLTHAALFEAVRAQGFESLRTLAQELKDQGARLAADLKKNDEQLREQINRIQERENHFTQMETSFADLEQAFESLSTETVRPRQKTNQIHKLKDQNARLAAELQKKNEQLLNFEDRRALLVAELQKKDELLQNFEDRRALLVAELQEMVELVRERDNRIEECENLYKELSSLKCQLEIEKEQAVKESEHLREENSRLKQNTDAECCICSERKPCVVFMPCRHMVICDSCHVQSTFTQCPLCRAQVSVSIKVFS